MTVLDCLTKYFVHDLAKNIPHSEVILAPCSPQREIVETVLKCKNRVIQITLKSLIGWLLFSMCGACGVPQGLVLGPKLKQISWFLVQETKTGSKKLKVWFYRNKCSLNLKKKDFKSCWSNAHILIQEGFNKWKRQWNCGSQNTAHSLLCTSASISNLLGKGFGEN